ncbi:MAG: LysE family transporter [Candidatus Thermoplasmatota archaeon]
MTEPIVAMALGLGLGLSLAAPPGPVNALIAREATVGGVRAGVRAGLPAPIVDTAYMLLVLFGVARLVDLESMTPWLATIGAALMAWLAVQVARVRDGAGKSLTGPAAVWMVTLTNPFQYAWWLSAGAGDLVQLGAFGIAGFLLAIFGWVFAFSGLVSLGALRWAWFPSAITVLSADLLLLYAIRLLWRGGLLG